MYIPLTLREYAERERTTGNPWADAMLEACDAQEMVDQCDTDSDHIKTTLEDHGVEWEKPGLVEAIDMLAKRDEAVERLIERQEENVWYAQPGDEPCEGLMRGIAYLRDRECELDEIREYLIGLGACDETSDMLATLRLLFG